MGWVRIAAACLLSWTLSGCRDKGVVATEKDLSNAGLPGVGDYEALHVLPSSAELIAGRSTSFEALGLLPYGNSRILTADGTWTVGSASILEVVPSITGRIRALAPGESDVIFTYQGVTRTARIQVASKSLDILKLSDEQLSFEVENIEGTVVPVNFNLVAHGLYSDGSTEDLSPDVDWICSAPTVITCLGEGRFTILGTGTSTITAQVGELKASAQITVTTHDRIFSKVSISPWPLIIERDSPKDFVITAHFSNGEEQDISALASVTVDNPGLVTIPGTTEKEIVGQALGNSTLRVNWSGHQTEGRLIVLDPISTQLVIESPKNFLLAKGDTEIFKVKLKYSDGSEEDVTSLVELQSSDLTVLDALPGLGYGHYKAAKAGHSTLSASVASLTVAQDVAIDAARLRSIAVTSVASGTLGLNLTRTFIARGTFSDASSVLLTANADWTIVSTGGGSGTFSIPGVFLASTQGTVRIVASSAGVSGTYDLTVGPAAPVTVEVLPAPVSGSTHNIGLTGGEQQLTARVTYSDGTIVDHTNTVDWSYVIVGENYSFAGYVRNETGFKGKVYPLAVGVFKVVAKFQGIAGELIVRVEP